MASCDGSSLGWLFANFHTHPVRVVMRTEENQETCKKSSLAFWADCKERYGPSIDHVVLKPGEIMDDSLPNVWAKWDETCILQVYNSFNGDRLLTLTLVSYTHSGDGFSLDNVGDRQDAGVYNGVPTPDWSLDTLNICLCVQDDIPNCGAHCANCGEDRDECIGGPPALSSPNASKPGRLRTLGLRGAASGSGVAKAMTKHGPVDEDLSDKAREHEDQLRTNPLVQLKESTGDSMSQP